MKEIFLKTTNLTHRENNLLVHHRNTTKYGDKSLRVLGPRIWNALPEPVKSETDLKSIQRIIQQWCGLNCQCSLCKF